MTRFVLLNLIAAGLLFAAYVAGWLQYFTVDQTRLSLGIFALAGLGVVAAACRKWRFVDFLIPALVRYGLFGTVVGLTITAANYNGEVADMVAGLAVAFLTTLAGMLGSEWLRILRSLL